MTGPGQPDPVVDVLGTAVRLIVPSRFVDEVASAIDALLPAGGPIRELRLEAEVGGQLRLVEDGEVVLSPVEPSVAVATLIWRLNTLAAASTDHVVVHAACVAAGGRGVLLPGLSGAGKSELSAACVADGLDYLSDEQAAVDLATGTLTPFPKPLDLKGRGLVSPLALGRGSVAGRATPAAIVFPCYDPEGANRREAMPPSSTLLALCRYTQNLGVVGATGFRRLADLATACPAWAQSYRSSAEGVASVRAALSGSAVTGQGTAPVIEAVPGDEAITAVSFGEEIVVHEAATGAVHHLNASAAFIWRSALEAPGDDPVASVIADLPRGALSEAEVRATIAWLEQTALLPTRRAEGQLSATGRPARGPLGDS